MSQVTITDLDDPRIADYRGLSDAELMRDRGLFVAEGRLVVARLLTWSRYRTRSVLVTPAARQALDGSIERRPDVPVYVCSQAAVNQITGFNIHRGCLALGERGETPVFTREWLKQIGVAMIIILEGVGNADNVGGVFRNAAAFGAAGVLLGPGCCDPLYRKAIRTSMAAALNVPFAHAGSWPHALDELRAAGLTVAAFTPRAGALDIKSKDIEDSRLALLFGSEGEGLSAEALARADLRVRIPIRDEVNSLNVATACGIALYALSGIAGKADDHGRT